MRAVVGSGTICMSEALMGCQPRTDEPSNPRPSSKSAWSRRPTGTVVCCHMPGRSMNLRSTNLQSWFLGELNDFFGIHIDGVPVARHAAAEMKILR